MAKSVEQRIAEKEAQVKRLKQQKRKVENGRKIIAGALVLEAARREPKIRQWFLKRCERYITREKDRERMKPVLEELRAMDRASDNSSPAGADGAGGEDQEHESA